jgi:hypothetical protein
MDNESGKGCACAVIFFGLFFYFFILNGSIDAVKELEYESFQNKEILRLLISKNIENDDELEDILDDNRNVKDVKYTKYSPIEYTKKYNYSELKKLNYYDVRESWDNTWVENLFQKTKLEQIDDDCDVIILSFVFGNNPVEFHFLVLKSSIWGTIKSFFSSDKFISSLIGGGYRPWAQVLKLLYVG